MSAQTWYVLYISAFSLSAALLITGVILFFKLNIPVIIGDLSGRTARKQIRMIRDSNAVENTSKQIPGIYNSTHRLGTAKGTTGKFEAQSGKETRGKTGDTRARSRYLGRSSDLSIVTAELNNKTELLNPDSLPENDGRTVCLTETSTESQGLTPFPNNKSAQNESNLSPATTLLSPEFEENQMTTVLKEHKFHIMKSIIVIHCNEVIE